MNSNSMTEENLKKKCKEKNMSIPANFNLPDHIRFVEKDQEIEMILTKEAIGKGEKIENMQEDAAAFEGWAVILNRFFQKNIKLDIAVELEIEELQGKFKGNGHFNRFLYRVLRFWEQYSWFFLSDNLDEILFAEGGFNDWLSMNKDHLTNNVPGTESKKEAEDMDKISEKWIERTMTGKESVLYEIIEDTDSERNGIFPQLPVGLFLNSVEEANRVFAGGSAAVDLWTWDRNKFYVFELKYMNKKVGIITELFFYANYLYDLLVEKNFVLNKRKTEKRGYQNLLENEFEEICAFMLVDENHPLIDDEVLKILNNNKSEKDIKIKYKMCKYKIDEGKKITLDGRH